MFHQFSGTLQQSDACRSAAVDSPRGSVKFLAGCRRYCREKTLRSNVAIGRMVAKTLRWRNEDRRRPGWARSASQSFANGPGCHVDQPLAIGLAQLVVGWDARDDLNGAEGFAQYLFLKGGQAGSDCRHRLARVEASGCDSPGSADIKRLFHGCHTG
ncbi:MAG: hypothetical protein E5W28_03380 [Mesorhizobium sp.]|nr:MAG: hypothetical protein E5W28_03380 [Mesorhizobium sp.]